MKLNKLILVPLISAILTFVKEISGFTLPDGSADIIAQLILLSLTALGIPMQFTKPKFDDADNFE